MSAVFHQHAGPPHDLVPGECTWRHHAFGTFLYCDSRALPGDDVCDEHLIEHVLVSLVRRSAGAT